MDAIIHLMEDVGRPMHYREITRQILDRGLWQSSAVSPEATVNSYISSDIKWQGEQSRFCRTAPGTYALREPEPLLLEELADEAGVVEPAASLMSFTDAAEDVLRRFANRQPMHYRDITQQALDAGLIVTRGKTPEATMYAQIGTEIDRQIRRGERPRFVKHGRGYFGLSQWTGLGLASQIEQHNQRVRKRLLEQVRGMGPIAFEELVGKVLTAIGFDSVEVTSAGGDGGIDVRGTLVVGEVIRTRMAVQVKRWKNNILAPVVQQVRGSLGAHEQGLIITTSDFSSGARLEAERADATPVGLMNGEQFVNLMIEHDIGIHRASHDIIELGEEEGEE